MTEALKLVGQIGSPYSRKMRAVLRYRRIPHQWLGHGSDAHRALPPSPLPLMPCLFYPTPEGYEATSDSTFMIRRLEDEFKGREVLPVDAALAFIDFLIEDYADEWVTKMMFHYRWAFEENVDNASSMLPRWSMAIPEDMANSFRGTFGERQVGRLGVVGSNAQTAGLIEASYERLLGILETHLRQHPFVMGQRPGSADFGLFGQLSQLVQVEPSSQRIARILAPRIIPWCDNVEDLSGWETSDDGWFDASALPESLRALLGEIGRTYAPFLLGNASALESGAARVECSVDGTPWMQDPFRYQGKCLGWLRAAYAALGDSERELVDATLAGSGCEVLFRA